jgi:hypothetical protein
VNRVDIAFFYVGGMVLSYWALRDKTWREAFVSMAVSGLLMLMFPWNDEMS